MTAPDPYQPIDEAERCFDELARALDRAATEATKLGADDILEQLLAVRASVSRGIGLLGALRANMADPPGS